MSYLKSYLFVITLLTLLFYNNSITSNNSLNSALQYLKGIRLSSDEAVESKLSMSKESRLEGCVISTDVGELV